MVEDPNSICLVAQPADARKLAVCNAYCALLPDTRQ